ncbi:hypothetical protein [Streptomyces varsoviensis]|uniref:hypothetical protein n=1 Tax=Streptomyces varsoviensis TaxID=67373 RepID=UPI003F4D33F3
MRRPIRLARSTGPYMFVPGDRELLGVRRWRADGSWRSRLRGGTGSKSLDPASARMHVDGPLAGDAVPGAALGQPLPQMAVVVALVGVECAGLAPTRASAGPDRWYSPRERERALAVVDVGAGGADGAR